MELDPNPLESNSLLVVRAGIEPLADGWGRC